MNVNSENTESEYLWKSPRPYCVYTVSLIIVGLTFNKDSGGICVFSCACALYLFNYKQDYLMQLSKVCNILSTLPVFFEAFPIIPVIYPMLHFFFGSMFSLEVGPGLFINFGVPSMAYLTVPLLFVRMAQLKSWQGRHSILIQHLLSVFWWQLAAMFFRLSSWSCKQEFTIVCTLLCMIATVMVVIKPDTFLVWGISHNFIWFLNCYGTYRLVAELTMTTNDPISALRIFSILGLMVMLTFGSRMRKLLLVISCVSFVALFVTFTLLESTAPGPRVTWQQYRSLCSRPRWEKTNIADSMVACSHLSGLMVDWNATVKKIVVKRVDNQAEAFLNLLPWPVSDLFTYVCGHKYSECSSVDDPGRRMLCEVSTMQGRERHMKNLNRYTFEIWVRLPLDDNMDNETEFQDVRVIASHRYKDVLMKIRDGEVINLHAMLVSELGNISPILKLDHITCESCVKPVTSSHIGVTEDSLDIVRRMARPFFSLVDKIII
ncbi:Wolframin [Lamellibrachia satsuma]|nr:Wolframin [Lamellibrachia satsuma]